MKRHRHLSAAALCIITLPALAPAQSPSKPAKKAADASTRASEREPADPLAEMRRQMAVTLLNSLADEARNFRNAATGARVQARSADALWDVDRERARTLFRRAWDAATTADEENERKMEEERRRQMAERGHFSMRSLPSLRREVLRLAARRDRALGEEFLAQMEEARKQDATSDAANADRQAASAPASTNPNEPSPAVAQRLRLAVQLLEDGNVERALQFADPALGSVNMPAVDFLVRLRAQNAEAADQRFAALVARAAADPNTDANTVSLLSSYLFTPSFYMTFERGGGTNSSRFGQQLPPPEVSAQLRAAFFNSAASILLRPLPPLDQDKSSAGRTGTYMVIARLAPLFEQYAPDKAAALRAQLAALQPDTPADKRDPRINPALTRGLAPEDPNRDRVQEYLDRLEGAQTDAERDEIYLNAAQVAFSRKDPRARELADKIRDIDLRKQVRSYLDFEMTERAIRDKNAEEALRLARGGELSAVQRAWALTEVARLLAREEPGRATEILDAALAEARRIDAASPDRVRALVAIATQLQPLDRPRTWEVISEIVKASNSSADFTGEDGFLMTSVQSKNQTFSSSSTIESFDLTGIFTTLAKEDFNRAVELAKSFTGESPRAVATLAVARAALEKKK